MPENLNNNTHSTARRTTLRLQTCERSHIHRTGKKQIRAIVPTRVTKHTAVSLARISILSSQRFVTLWLYMCLCVCVWVVCLLPFTLNPCGRCISGSFALVFDACCRQFHAQKTLRFARCMRVYISFLSSQLMLRYSHWKLNVYCDIMNTNAFSQTFAEKTHFVFSCYFCSIAALFFCFFLSLTLSTMSSSPLLLL